MRLRSAFLQCCAAVLLGGPVFAAEKDPVWTERAVPGPAVTIRMKRNVGKSLIYDGTLERSQQSASSYVETSKFLLNILTADQKEILVKEARKRLDLVAIWRTFTERNRTEILENKKKVERVLENSNDLINLGPNFEMVGTLRCYGFDGQNSVAFATQQVITTKNGGQVHGRILSETNDKIVFLSQEEKIDLKRSQIEKTESIPIPHVLLNETPHYLFPIFSQRQVAPGDTWKFRVPVIIPLEQGNPPRLLPTQFTAVMIGRLREVRTAAGGQVAVVDYQVSGEFDSNGDEAATRFPEEFLSNNRIVHRISGSGTVSVDVEKGRLLDKTENFSITLYALAVTPQGADQEAKKDENQADIVSKFSMSLVPPGTKLKNGQTIPEYDDVPAGKNPEDGAEPTQPPPPETKEQERERKKREKELKEQERKRQREKEKQKPSSDMSE
jgi:hypothetical protein